ncbi:MAG: hypothetical protein IJZ10_07400, partial [Thermoguttaceae bacterium]|nr:hypothetical protein [Thermoguttaceae bacterium]
VDATTVKIVLDAPEVDATTVDSSTLTFEIKEVANADYYEYEYSTSRYFTAETTTSGTATSAGAFDVSGLQPFTTYYFRAKAVVDAASPKAETHESSAWSTEASATTAKAALPAPAISAVALDSTTLALTIEPVANAAGYVYLMSTDPDFADAEEISRGSGTRVLVGLTPGATYYFKAVAKAAENDAYVDSDWSEPTSATLPVVLNAPAISAQATSHTTVALTVGAVDNASSYVVEYSSTPDFATVEGDFTLTAADFTDGVARLSAVELTGYTMYYFRAKAVGTGVYLDSDFAATEKRTWENPSTFVTIESDVVDPTDNLYSLREAVEVYAQAGDYVSFKSGIPTVKLDKGHLTIDKPLTIDGSAAMPEDGVGGVTIDAQGLSRVVYVPKYTIYNDYVNFNFLTFTGGNAVKTDANAGEHDPAYGGGLYLGANATFSYCVIADNVAQAAGGGVFVDVRLDAELVTQEPPTYFVGVKFVGNAAGTLGGGLYVSSTGDVTVQDGAISENKAKYGAGLLVNGKTSVSSTAIFGNEASVQGGGVFVDKSGTLDASYVKIEGNAASQVGGGVYVNGVATFNNASVSENDAVTGAGVAVSVRGNATLSGGELTGNVATDFGGALRVSGTATVKNVGISSNSAAKFGGGVYVDKTGTADIVDGATIYQNSAKYGAGVFVNGEATLENAQLLQNVASIQGGGLYVDKGAVATLTGVSLGLNSATNAGGGAYLNGTATFDGASQIYQNEAPIGAGANVGTLGNATFTDAYLYANLAAQMGGGLSVSGAATVENCEFFDNEAGTQGGGLFVDAPGTATVAGTSFTDNKATYAGGGVYLSGTASVSNATIVGNAALYGAGACVFSAETSTFAETAIYENVAGEYGGGVCVGEAGKAAFENNEIYANEATQFGGGLYVGKGAAATVDGGKIFEN